MWFGKAAPALFPLFVLATQPAPAQQTRIYPPDPQVGEIVAAVVDIPSFGYTSAIRFSRVEPGRIIFSYNAASTQQSWHPALTLPAPPAGDYRVFIQQDAAGAEPVQVDSLQFSSTTGSPAVPAHRGVTGNWYSPDENGWGVNVIEGENGPQLFVMWLDYLNANLLAPVGVATTFASGSTWRVMSGGRWIDPHTFRGVLYQTTGGTSAASASQRARIAPVGYATLTFLDSGEMDFRAVLRMGPAFREFTKQKRLRRQGL